MSVSYRYAREKFVAAARELALGPEDIKVRILEAHRCFCVLSEEDLPSELQADFRWIRDQLSQKPPLRAYLGSQIISGSVEQSLRSIRRKKRVAIAERILHIRDSLY